MLPQGSERLPGKPLTHVGQGQVQQALHHRVDADRPDAAGRSHSSAQHHGVLFVFGRQDLELLGDLHGRAALAEEVLRGESTSLPSRPSLDPSRCSGLPCKLSVTCHATPTTSTSGSPSVGRGDGAAGQGGTLSKPQLHSEL